MKLNKSIAIVDDNEFYREVLIEIILSNGFMLSFAARDGNDCIQQMKQTDLLPDIIILDIEMPMMNGYQTAMELKERWPGVKIIGHSSLKNVELIDKMMACGADHFINKGCNLIELVNLISQVADMEGHHL